MARADLRIADANAFQSRLLDHHARRPVRFVKPGLVAKHRTAVGQVQRKLFPAFFQDGQHISAHFIGSALPKFQFHAENNALLLLKNRMTVRKTTLRGRDGGTVPLFVQNVHADNGVADILSETAAVHIKQSAQVAGDAHDMFEPRQAAPGARPRQRRSPDPGFRFDPRAGKTTAAHPAAQFYDRATVTGVVEKHVGTVADDKKRNVCLYGKAARRRGLLRATRFDHIIRGAADLPVT